MAWTAFSAEAIDLKLKVLKLEREGRVSEATDAVSEELAKSHADGPSGESYADFMDRAEKASLA